MQPAERPNRDLNNNQLMFCSKNPNIEPLKPFQDNLVVIYTLLGFIFTIYIIPIMYVLKKRNHAETRARSPYVTSLCLTLLMLDSLMNTWIFTLDVNDPHA